MDCCQQMAENIEPDNFINRNASHILLDKETGKIDITGCCFNCNVVEDIKYCPFCGKEIVILDTSN
jgi:hypothetical protein